MLQLLWVASCASAPPDTAKTYSDSQADTGHTYFGELAAGWQQLHGSSSGFFPLSQGMDALGVRLDMARKAQATIDLQYFLMKDDTAGLVVMLVDDNNHLNWNATIDGETVQEFNQPLTTRWQRFRASLMKVVPESQL